MYNGYTCECLLSSIITIYIHISTNFYSVNTQCTMLYHRKLQYLCVNMFTLFSLFSIFLRPHTSFTGIIFLSMPIYIKKAILRWTQLIARIWEMLTKGVIFLPTWEKRILISTFYKTHTLLRPIKSSFKHSGVVKRTLVLTNQIRKEWLYYLIITLSLVFKRKYMMMVAIMLF